MTLPLSAQRRPFHSSTRMAVSALVMVAAMACVPIASHAAVSYSATQTVFTPPVPPVGPELSLPSGTSAWAIASNARGDVAGTLRSDTFYEVFKAGPFNAAQPDIAGYRFVGMVSNQFGTWANYQGLSQEAFVTQNGQFKRLGTLGFGESSARFINERGDAAGDLFDRQFSVNIVNGQRVANPDGAGFAEGRTRQHAFFYDGTTMKDLGTLGGSTSIVTALNNRGDVLGMSSLAGDQSSQAFLYRDGVMTALGAAGQGGFASLLNDSGTVAGVAGNRAFVYQDGVFHDLFPTEGSYSHVNLLTSSNVVVGGQWVASPDEPVRESIFVYKDGVTTVLPTLFAKDGRALNMRPTSVNDRGDVLGFGFAGGYDEFHTFVYRDGEMVDLSGLIPMQDGFPLFGFGNGSIDNDGRITLQNGISALVLTPTTAVPEPATAAYLLVGLGLMGAVNRARRQGLATQLP